MNADLSSARLLRVFVALLLATSLVPVPLLAQEAPAPSGDTEGQTTRAAVVSRHGIRWLFDRECVVGTFANGDPWVLGPVNIVGIEPKCVEIGGRVLHGSMIDPNPKRMMQGYDSHMFEDKKRERYDDALNVARGIAGGKPLELGAGHSLISVESRSDPSLCPTLKTAAVLTCLGALPAPDAFRPPYVAGNTPASKVPKHRIADLDFQVLLALKATIDAPPIEVVASGFERLWLDHFPEWPTRYSHPLDNMPDYGRDMASQIGSAALALQFDIPVEQKRDLAVRLVQMGLDLHACLIGGCIWQGIGGHGHGRKLPILFAGLVLHDDAMLAIGKSFLSERRSATEGTEYLGEDGQTFFVRETNKNVWNWGFGSYTKDHDGLPEWGFSHAQSPKEDRASWDENPYRRCCTANGWVGEVLAARMLGLQEAWHHPALFDYMDRYMQVRHTDDWHRSWLGWHASMWDAYRTNY